MATTASPTVSAQERTSKRSEGQWAIVFRRFRRHRMAMISLGVLAVMLTASVLAPVIAPFPRDHQDLQSTFVTPMGVDVDGRLRILGSERLGQDLFTRLLYAARISLTTAIFVSILAAMVGVIFGLLAGYFGGWVDMAITRTVEFISTFPSLPILLIMASILVRADTLITLPDIVVKPMGFVLAVSDREAKQVTMVILVLAFLSWTTIARLMRGMVLSVREMQYIESSRALGGSNLRIIARHVFPNALPPLIVSFTLLINDALVAESALSFLGFGIQPPTPTWGNMLSMAQSFMFQHPWMPLVPSLALLITAISVNYVGDGLRDALDPRQKI
ncbi:MAG: ABC transporter permease [Chloroflexales bacterium]|nr:ABC transporter permease [Chloroflexales bacterium]